MQCIMQHALHSAFLLRISSLTPKTTGSRDQIYFGSQEKRVNGAPVFITRESTLCFRNYSNFEHELEKTNETKYHWISNQNG